MGILSVMSKLAGIAGVLAVVGAALTLLVYFVSTVWPLPDLQSFIKNDPLHLWSWLFSGTTVLFIVIALFQKGDHGLKPAAMALAGVVALAATHYENYLFLTMAGIVLFAGFVGFVRGFWDNWFPRSYGRLA